MALILQKNKKRHAKTQNSWHAKMQHYHHRRVGYQPGRIFRGCVNIKPLQSSTHNCDEPDNDLSWQAENEYSVIERYREVFAFPEQEVGSLGKFVL